MLDRLLGGHILSGLSSGVPAVQNIESASGALLADGVGLFARVAPCRYSWTLSASEEDAAIGKEECNVWSCNELRGIPEDHAAYVCWRIRMLRQHTPESSHYSCCYKIGTDVAITVAHLYVINYIKYASLMDVEGSGLPFT